MFFYPNCNKISWLIGIGSGLRAKIYYSLAPFKTTRSQTWICYNPNQQIRECQQNFSKCKKTILLNFLNTASATTDVFYKLKKPEEEKCFLLINWSLFLLTLVSGRESPSYPGLLIYPPLNIQFRSYKTYCTVRLKGTVSVIWSDRSDL